MSSKRMLPNGFTLMEMVVTIVLFGVITVIGSQLFSQLAPSYRVAIQSERALSPREAAMWQLSEDFRRTLLLEGQTKQGALSDCMVSMLVADGVSGTFRESVISYVVTYWMHKEGGINQLWVSNHQVKGVLLNEISPKTLIDGNWCPIRYEKTGCNGRMCLYVDFDYPDPNKADVHIPVSAILYSYVNGPYVAAITPGTGAVSTTIPVTVSGIFPGVTAGNIAFMSGIERISWTIVGTPDFNQIKANISSVSPATVDVTVSTVHGKSTLRGQFIIN